MRYFTEEAHRVEQFSKQVLANYLGVKESEIEHVSDKDPQNIIDLRYKDQTYDVKHSAPVMISKTKTKKVWDFDLRGKQNYCNFLILVGLLHNRYSKVYLVPGNISPKHHIRISIYGISKWQKYEILTA